MSINPLSRDIPINYLLSAQVPTWLWEAYLDQALDCLSEDIVVKVGNGGDDLDAEDPVITCWQ